MAPWRMFRRIKLSVIRIKDLFSLCSKTLIGTLTQSRYQALRLIKYGRQKRGHHFQIYLVNIKKTIGFNPTKTNLGPAHRARTGPRVTAVVAR